MPKPSPVASTAVNVSASKLDCATRCNLPLRQINVEHFPWAFSRFTARPPCVFAFSTLPRDASAYTTFRHVSISSVGMMRWRCAVSFKNLTVLFKHFAAVSVGSCACEAQVDVWNSISGRVNTTHWSCPLDVRYSSYFSSVSRRSESRSAVGSSFTSRKTDWMYFVWLKVVYSEVLFRFPLRGSHTVSSRSR